ncbi:MAG: hypothetical protein ACLFQU_11945 [Candidatus Kapaibacterium sp.]
MKRGVKISHYPILLGMLIPVAYFFSIQTLKNLNKDNIRHTFQSSQAINNTLKSIIPDIFYPGEKKKLRQWLTYKDVIKYQYKLIQIAHSEIIGLNDNVVVRIYK